MKSGEVKLFIGILIAAIVLVGVAIYPMIVKPPDPMERFKVKVKNLPDKFTREYFIKDWAHQRGDPASPYTLVEFGDYQCPTCAKSQPLIDELVEKYKDKMDYVFHYFRIASGHYNADMLAMAAEAAGEQGKYWEMHKLLMASRENLLSHDQGELAEELMKLAGKAKLDVIAFRQALTGDKARKAVARTMNLGKDANLIGTPTFYVISNRDQKAIMEVREPHELQKWLDTPNNWPVAPTVRIKNN